MENGPYIRNGNAYGRPTLSGKARLRFEQYLYLEAFDDNGVVRDASASIILNWKPGQSRQGKVDVGHKSGLEYNAVFQGYKYGDLTLDELKMFQFDPKNFQLEEISENRSHRHEAKREGSDFFG